MENRVVWIDLAKTFAIVAVICDHSSGHIGYSGKIFFFSVSLFIFLAGITAYSSDIRNLGEEWHCNIIRHSKKIVVAYCVSVLLYEILDQHRFNLIEYVQWIIQAKASGPHYFVFLYLQLMIIDYWVFRIVHRIKGKYQVFIGIGIGVFLLLFGAISRRYTNILGLYGGAGKLFGATYLFLYYAGMLASKYGFFSKGKRFNLGISYLGGIVFFFMEIVYQKYGFVMESIIPWNDENYVNPPSITLILISLSAACMCYSLSMSLDKFGWGGILSQISKIGKHTLFIFLYHMLFIEILNNYLYKVYDCFDNNVVAVIINIIVSILGSIMIEVCIKYLKMGWRTIT